MNSMEWRVMLLVLLVWFHKNGCFGCWEQEKIALLQIKASINYPNGDYLPSWKDTDKDTSDCCDWERVECNVTTRRVTKLSLNCTRDRSLDGFYIQRSNKRTLEKWDFNASLFLPFIDLRVLDLSGNELIGWIPNQGFERLIGLNKLEALILDYNFYNYSILQSLRVLSSLTTVSINHNKLDGSVDIQDFCAMSNLEELDLSYNWIDSLVIPRDKNCLSRLRVLTLKCQYYDAIRLQYSNLRSSILQSLGALQSLKTLSVSVKGLVAVKDLEALTSLEHLDLDYSSIKGSFLHNVGVMTSLRSLSLRSSGLGGNLPAQGGWCNLKNLQELDLSENDFVGILPSCLGNLTSLRQLDLSLNHFNGNINESPLTSLMALEYISLSYNHLKVPFSFASFFNHSKLKVILSDNNILTSVENKFQSWIPRFQLEAFSCSNCTINRLPNFLYDQNSLIFVDLSYNHLASKLPTWLLENNTRLDNLSLENNYFTGPLELPRSLKNQVCLLDLSNNYISGELPTNLNLIFPSLQHMNLSRNMFQGNIPSSLGDLRSLMGIDLSKNNLSGKIPKHLAMGCSSLRFLKLSNNHLHGQIFPNAKSFNLTKLKWLFLDNNHFVGKIPDSLSNTNLWAMDMSNNHLSGMLPQWIGNMSDLKEFDLSRNQLEGPIPIKFCELNDLEFLDLSNNNLSGSIPSCFSPSSIRYIHLHKNGLSGLWTHAFYNSTCLVTLDLGDNSLTGSIPGWIGHRLSALSILLLKANHFKGVIPSQLCHLNQISLIDLSHNNLSGPIPNCLINITFKPSETKSFSGSSYLGDLDMMTLKFSLDGRPFTGMLMSVFHYAFNRGSAHALFSVKEEVEFTTKSRSYSYEGIVLNFMSGVDFSCNQLTGEIPLQLGNLTEIHTLNLSHNNLIGFVPTTFSNLKNIESLDLSYNNLSGNIPTQLIDLNSLAVFSVAHNNLSGKTPGRKAQFATFNGSSYEGNPYLCGPPLPNNCNDTGSPLPIPISFEKDDGFIDMDFFYVTFSVSYIIVLLGIAAVLCINPYWRRAWFNFIEMCMISSYYFVLDSFHKLLNC